MREITRVGVDLAKHVIQVHAVDATGTVVTNRPLPRDKFMAWCAQLPADCMVAMEASSSAHHWARKMVALGLDARIIAAHLVAPYRLQGKSGKNDANDAAAICEAASRPQMHFVPIKTVEQQSMLCIHRLREGFKQERTACTNRIRGLLAEFGLVCAQSLRTLRQTLPDMMEDARRLNGRPNHLRFLARRDSHDAVNRSDRRQASPTNPLWRTMGGDHGNAMGPCRAAPAQSLASAPCPCPRGRAWSRTRQYLGSHCRSCAINLSVHVQSVPVGSHRYNTTMQENRHQGKLITAYA